MPETDAPLLLADVRESDLSPMMQHYVQQKRQRSDCLLFYRLGDFFELFFDDAILVSKELGLTLTGKECGLSRRAPMCGVPHHAADGYIKRLIDLGYKVAVCEQVEDPAQAKGIVQREVVRVISPGTLTDPEMIDALSYRYIAVIYAENEAYGLAFADLSAMKIEATEILGSARDEQLLGELERMHASEWVCNKNFLKSDLYQKNASGFELSVTPLDEEAFSFEDIPESFFYLRESENAFWTRALLGLLHYLKAGKYELPDSLPRVRPYRLENYLILDKTARAHLEISRTLKNGERRGSLIWALDLCQTSMGSRLLKEHLEQPLTEKERIEQRLDRVEAFRNDYLHRSQVRDRLGKIYDLERLSGRLALGNAGPRDLASIAAILAEIPAIQDILSQMDSAEIRALSERLDPLSDLCEVIQSSFADELPLFARDGGVFRDGANAQLDAFRHLARDGQSCLLEYETKERERSGIKSLKLKYNRVFGYAIEISKGNTLAIPENYVRRQTLSNSERYVTEELKQLEESIVGAEQKALQLEQKLFQDLIDRAFSSLSKLRENAVLLSEIDLASASGELAERSHACRPEIFDDFRLKIRAGRHPVVEKMLPDDRHFVPNDLDMNGDERRLMILTGPNMAGKSTFMRQNALLVIMAQAGLFVPAESAEIGIVDQIFTRVGASDDLGAGQSTFMVEMNEMAEILTRASVRSLLILDEIGRGTSTWDGLSIAWSCIEHIADASWLGCRCLFATHYHELIALESILDGVFNAHVDITRSGNELIFLHELRPGGSGNSYGLDVARMAGVPETVILRAQNILLMLEKENHGKQLRIRKNTAPSEGQIDLFSAARHWSKSDALIQEIQSLDINHMSPMEALQKLQELQKQCEQNPSLTAR